MANEAYKAIERDGIYFIDCPECGREIQTRQAEFESMDEAFCEALAAAPARERGSGAGLSRLT